MSTEDLAQRIWNNGGPLKGSLAETYLAGRALTLPVTGSLRFAASLPHKSGVNYPAMLAQAVDVNGAMTGIQRTFLAHDGSGKAPLPNGEAKMSLGVIKRSLVRPADLIDGAPLLLGEGIETVLTPMQATGFPGWATLGTAGLSAVNLPGDAKDIILLGENDGGKSAAAIAKAALDLKKKGIRVRVAYPPQGFKDFNDMVNGVADRMAAFEAVRAAIVDAKDFVDPLDNLVERAKTDPGAPFQPEALMARGVASRQPAAV